MISLLISFALFAGDYFVIQNVASERTRIYEKCHDIENCQNRLVAEIPMLVGMSEERGRGLERYRYRTWLGNSKISAWKKFYQDGAAKYPPWYSPNLRMPPSPGADIFEWMKRKYLANSEQEARGAFGWYAAHLEPDVGYQWMHGTFGWAEDGDYFMQKIHSDTSVAYLNFSSGCTRMQNAAIALMQHLLPVGTEVYRIYAKEGLADESRYAYQDQQSPLYWDFLLTKEDVNRRPSYSSDKEEVLSLGLPSSYILDEGTYEIDQYPDPVSYKRIRQRVGRGAGMRRQGIVFYQGDVYELGRDSFRGTYYVDSGQLSGYQHPQGKIMVGGNKKPYPPYLVAQ